MVQVSEDIFYQVKKEILDKLDIILQKVNLQIINYLHPEEESFSFIELSSFEHEITHLFHYLDRFYASLNTSVSFSSINSFKSSVDNHLVENQRLTIENQKLHKTIQELTLKNHYEMTFQKDTLFHPRQAITPYLQQLKEQTTEVMQEFKLFGKDMKKALKKYKFEMLQLRVEVISKLKDLQSHGKPNHQHLQHLPQRHGEDDAEQLLQAINQILLLC